MPSFSLIKYVIDDIENQCELKKEQHMSRAKPHTQIVQDCYSRHAMKPGLSTNDLSMVKMSFTEWVNSIMQSPVACYKVSHMESGNSIVGSKKTEQSAHDGSLDN